MKRYRFSLQSALRARRAQEDVARQHVAEVNHRLRQAQVALEATRAAYRAVTISAVPSDRESFVAALAHEARMAEAVVRAERAVAEIQVEAATVHSAWVEAAKRVASLERLDERRRAEWDIEARRDEALAVDDVVASRWSLAGSLSPTQTGERL